MPVSFVFADLHEDFLKPIELYETEENKMPLVTPDKVKDKLAEVRCNVSFNLKNKFDSYFYYSC